MSATCVMCGSSVPDGQRVCSMCYGDIDYGKDGHYRDWAERIEQTTEQPNEEQP